MKINGIEFRIPTLDIFQEFAFASKISPILSMMSLQEDRSVLEAKFPQAFTALTGDMRMSRADKDEVISLCLSGVSRVDNGVSSPVLVGGRLMYQDMSLDTVLKIVWQVIVQHKLIDFFSTPHSSLTDQPEKPESSGSDIQTAG